MMRIRRLATWLIAWIVVSMPSVAAACAVCSAGKDEENAFAFLMSTIFMSLMPLLAIGTLVFVLWRRIQKLEAETAERDARTGDPAAQSIPTL